MRWRRLVVAAVAVAAAGATAVVWQVRSEPERSAPVDGPLDGAALFTAKGCAGCHQGPDASDVSIGCCPDLSDARAWAGDRRPGLSAEEYIAESIRSPGAFVSPAFRPSGPTDGMPTLNLSDEEIDQLVAYLLGD